MNSFYPHIRVKRINPDAPMPKYAHDGDAGMDLCSMEDVELYPGETKKVGTGVAMAIPDGWVGLVFPRSGLGSKGLTLSNCVGVIDSGYRGEIQATLHFNQSSSEYWISEQRQVDGSVIVTKNTVKNLKSFKVRKGDRVAQIVFVPFGSATLQEVEDLDETDRGAGSFGSTGVSTITGGDRL